MSQTPSSTKSLKEIMRRNRMIAQQQQRQKQEQQKNDGSTNGSSTITTSSSVVDHNTTSRLLNMVRRVPSPRKSLNSMANSSNAVGAHTTTSSAQARPQKQTPVMLPVRGPVPFEIYEDDVLHDTQRLSSLSTQPDLSKLSDQTRVVHCDKDSGENNASALGDINRRPKVNPNKQDRHTSFVQLKTSTKDFAKVDESAMRQLSAAKSIQVSSSVNTNEASPTTQVIVLDRQQLHDKNTHHPMNVVVGKVHRVITTLGLLASGMLAGVTLVQFYMVGQRENHASFLSYYSAVVDGLRFFLYYLVMIVLLAHTSRARQEWKCQPMWQQRSHWAKIRLVAVCCMYTIGWLCTLIAVPIDDKIQTLYRLDKTWFNDANAVGAIQTDLNELYNLSIVRFLCCSLFWLVSGAESLHAYVNHTVVTHR